MTDLRLDLTEDQAKIVGSALLTALRVSRLAVGNWERYLRSVALEKDYRDRFEQVIEAHRERIGRIEEARELLEAAPAIDAAGAWQ